MSIYQRGENWYIDFTFKGQRIRESIGPSRKGAEKVIAKKKAEIAENKFLDVRKDPDPVTFYDFAKQYLEWSKTNKKASSYYRQLCLMRQLEREFGSMTIQEITTWQIEKYKSKRRESLCPGSVNREIALLKHLYSKAIEWGKCKESPAKKVKLLRGEVKRVRFLMPDEIHRLISNCNDYLKPLVVVAIHTGMRKSELINLTWDRVNLDQGIISLADTKNGERRDFPINKTVKTTLAEIKNRGPYVFGGERKKDYLHVYRTFKEVVKKSGIEDFRWHDMRHCFASTLVMAGEDLNTVGELLGHKGLEMTRRYAHLSPKFKKKTVDVLDEVLSQNPPQAEKPEAKVLNFKR